MTGKKTRSGAKPEVEQAAPTAARPVDANGRELDQYGLPLNGPARVAALAELGKPDPNDAPEVWADPDDVPELGKDWFDKAELRKGDEIVTPGSVTEAGNG